MDTTYAPLLTRRTPIFVEAAPEEAGQSLVLRAQAGDSDAFARLFHAYADRVHSYMYFQVADEIAAEDLTARVFNKAWKNIRCYGAGQLPFSVWLYQIARDALVDFIGEHRQGRAVMEVIMPEGEGLDGYGSLDSCGEDHDQPKLLDD